MLYTRLVFGSRNTYFLSVNSLFVLKLNFFEWSVDLIWEDLELMISSFAHATQYHKFFLFLYSSDFERSFITTTFFIFSSFVGKSVFYLLPNACWLVYGYIQKTICVANHKLYNICTPFVQCTFNCNDFSVLIFRVCLSSKVFKKV